MKNILHIMDRIPIVEEEGMYRGYEVLAKQLFDSGLVRIDTGTNSNFARLVDANRKISMMISKEELEGDLLADTKKKLAKYYIHQKHIDKAIENCQKQITRLMSVSDEVRMKLCRLIVQSAHPIIIKWILLEKVEIFISYTNEIGDMMDIQTWKHSGKNSGMQSTDGRDVAIFISTGGDPFGKTDPEMKIYGDGFPAMARFLIVGGQELGHYADIKRDKFGRQIGRHSANFACTMPSAEAKSARKDDMEICKAIRESMMKKGLERLIKHEKSLRFYHRNKVFGMRSIYEKLMTIFYRKKLLRLLKAEKKMLFQKFLTEDYPGIMIDAMITDMEDNLAPIADVYKREDPNAAEAVACAEALARVPQQANKWGHIATSKLMHNLYGMYFKNIIPELIYAYERKTGKKHNMDYHKIPYSYNTKFNQFMALFKKADKPFRELEK